MSGGTTINTGEKPTKKRRQRSLGEHGEHTLYRRVVSESGAVRYLPCAERWDSSVIHYGDFLLHAEPGRSSCTRLDAPGADRVSKQRAALVAASLVAEQAMVLAMVEASKVHPAQRLATPREQKAWKAYCDIMGEEGLVRLEVSSAQEIVDAGIKALVAAVEKAR